MNAGSIGQTIINGTYGLESEPKKATAYEELKAWCEKHLEKSDYTITPANDNYLQAIYFSSLFVGDDVGAICFEDDGSVSSTDTIPYNSFQAHLIETNTLKEGETEEDRAELIEYLREQAPKDATTDW